MKAFQRIGLSALLIAIFACSGVAQSSIGIISTAGGAGGTGFCGDAGPATPGTLFLPFAGAVDGTGNLFIADAGNNRIRKVTPDGTITTVAGSGAEGFGGDLGSATAAQLFLPVGVTVDAAGNLLIADSNNERIRKVTSGGTISTVAGNGTIGFGGNLGQATSAQLSVPYGVAVDG